MLWRYDACPVIKIAWHMLKRLLRFNLPISILGAVLMSPQFLVGESASASARVSGLVLRFVLIACSAGHALSLWAYRRLYRNELAMYSVAGYHFRHIAVVSYTWELLGLGAAFIVVLTAISWIPS
jgi:hypothetical protein